MGVVSLKFKRSALALVPVLALLGTTSVPARASVPAPPNAYDAITEFDAYAGSGAFEVITGPDGNLWYTGPNNDRVVKADPASGATLSTVLLGNGTGSCAPTGITIGPDRNIWVACFEGSSVVRINPTTLAHTAVSLPATALSIKFGCTCPVYLAAGPDSYLWVTENGPGYVTKINVTTLAIHRYALPAGMDADPRGITVGSDGKLWIAEAFINRIGRMTTSGTLTTFAVPTSDGRPWGMVTGPDGNVYYTEINGNKIGRITTSGVSSEFPIPTSGSQPRDINVGPDGNLWFAEYGASKIGSMTLDGMMQEVATTTASAKPFGIVTGPDGNLWFTEINSNKIAKMGARHSALTLDKTAIGFGNINIGATTATQRITLTNNGAESLAGLTPSLAAGGAGGPSGSFASGGETCSGGSIAAAGTCYQDVSFTATSTPGSAGSRVDFLTDAATNYQQKPSAGLSASVNVPTCASVAVAPSVTSPQNVGTAVTLNATSAGCTDASPNYRFYLRSPAAAWSIVQPFSTSPSFAWNTTGYAPGTYLIGVWVKDALSTKTYDAYAFGTFTLQSPNCTSTNMSGSAQSPQVIGATVTFTASALGCPSPRFQWWVRNPEAIWSIAVPFAAGNTFSWDTTTLEAGTWQIGIWAKQVGSSKSYDAFSFLTYTLTTAAIGPPINQPCSAVNADATPASPQDKGTAVTLTATPFGCDAPLYKFWIRDTSAVWAVVQDYSPTNTYAWSTVSRPAGTYLV
ncbi:MAG: virginiamycin lyase, partial [Frankiales bacterium]|nr:virginiamycin lyase [Frankiales bacterium]